MAANQIFRHELDPRSIGDFNKTLQRLAVATDRPIESIIRQQGRLLARDLAHWILPVGKDPSIGRSFQQTIRSSVSRFYRPVGLMHKELAKIHGQARADTLVMFIRRGHIATAQKLLNSSVRLNHAGAITVGPFDGGRLHKRHRWKKGSKRNPILIVTNWPEAKAYIEQTARLAGFAKGALINAGRQLDGKDVGVPLWIKRHRNAPARGYVSRQGKRGFFGDIVSHVRYAREALPVDKELRAIDHRNARAIDLLKRITDHNLRKIMSSQRTGAKLLAGR